MTTVRLKLMWQRTRAKLLLTGLALGWSLVNERLIMLYAERLENDVRHMNAILKTRPSR